MMLDFLHVPAGLPLSTEIFFISASMWLVLRPCDHFCPNLYNSKFQMKKKIHSASYFHLPKICIGRWFVKSAHTTLQHLSPPNKGITGYSVVWMPEGRWLQIKGSHSLKDCHYWSYLQEKGISLLYSKINTCSNWPI